MKINSKPAPKKLHRERLSNLKHNHLFHLSLNAYQNTLALDYSGIVMISVDIML